MGPQNQIETTFIRRTLAYTYNIHNTDNNNSNNAESKQIEAK